MDGNDVMTFTLCFIPCAGTLVFMILIMFFNTVHFLRLKGVIVEGRLGEDRED